MRKVVRNAIKNQHLRLAAMHRDKSKVNLSQITFDDVKTFELNKDGFVFNKKTIGFRRMSD